MVCVQLLPLMDRALESTSLQTGPLFSQVADMLLSWEKRAAPAGATEEASAGNEATFGRALTVFWEGLGRLCLRHVDSEQPEQKALEGIATLLRVIHNPESGSWRQAKRKKKSVKISFSGLEGREPGEEAEEEGGSQEARAQEALSKVGSVGSPTQGRSSSGHLLELVCQLAEVNMVHVTERGSERHLRFLSMMLQAFPTRQVFQVLLPGEADPEMKPEAEMEEKGKGSDLGLGDAELARNPAVRFLLLKVVAWLKQEGRKDTEFLVDMVFSALHCCASRPEKTHILNHITTVSSDENHTSD